MYLNYPKYLRKYFIISYWCIGDSFCIGFYQPEGFVALYCPTEEENSTESLAEYEEFSSSVEIVFYFSVAVRILDFLSTLSMAFMGVACFFMLPAGEVEIKFLSHFSSSLSLAHAFYFYNFFSSYGILPQFCLTCCTYLLITYFF